MAAGARSAQCDVLIVGAGPVGIMLALELKRQALNAIVIERLAQPDETIKAQVISGPNAELFDRRGILEKVMAAEPEYAKAKGVAGHGHFSLFYKLTGKTRRIGIQQHALEEILNQHALESGIHIRRSTEMVSFECSTNSVHISAKGPEGELFFDTKFLVGCDGGRSGVRKMAGFEFAGLDSTSTAYQGIAETSDPAFSKPGRYQIRTLNGMVNYGPLPGRIFMIRFDGPPKSRERNVTKEEFQDCLRYITGRDTAIIHLSKATRSGDQTRQATSYRKGRVFLAGDSAHVYPPFGGQGLYLGFEDAVNLGWKLAAVLQGWASDDLLNTYFIERYPVGARVLENCRAQFALMRTDPQTSALRDLFSGLLEITSVSEHVSFLMSGNSIRHEMACEHPLAGCMIDDRQILVSGELRRLFEILRAPKGVFVEFSGDNDLANSVEPWKARIHIVRANRQNDGLRAILIRPDGIVAWASSGKSQTEAKELQSSLMKWFGFSQPANSNCA